MEIPESQHCAQAGGSSFPLQKIRRLWAVFFWEKKLTESLKYPTEKNTHARERIWRQISGKDAEYWTNGKKKNSHLLPSEKTCAGKEM